MIFCSTSGSWTDLVTNRISLAKLSTADLRDLFSDGRLPSSLYADFMHEATHRTCFTRPVGQVIAQQFAMHQMAAFLRAAFGYEITRDRVEELIRSGTTQEVPADYVALGIDPDSGAADIIFLAGLREQIFVELLRPITEGMALFGEFFAFRRHSAFLTSMATGAVTYFGNPPKKGPDYFLQDESGSLSVNLALPWMMRMLGPTAASRLGDDALARLMFVLSQPVTSKVGASYGLGYMAVRRIFTALSDRVAALGPDSDMFLGYLTDYLFADFSAVALALSQFSGRELAENFAWHLAQRLQKLIKSIGAEEIGTWLRYVEVSFDDTNKATLQSGLVLPKETAYDELLRKAIAVPVQDWHQGKEFLARSRSEMLNLYRSHAENAPVLELLIRQLAEREKVMPVGSIPATVRITCGGRYQVVHQGQVVVERETPLDGQTLAQASQADGGRVEVVCLVDSGVNVEAGHVLYVYMGDLLIDVVLVCAERDRARLRRVAEEFRYDIHFTQKVHDRCSKAMSELTAQPRYQRQRDEVLNYCNTAVQTIYRRFVLAFVPATKQESVWKALATGGVQEIIGDPRLFEAYCVLSLAASLVQNEDFLRQELQARSFDLDSVLEALDEVQRNTGFHLFDREDDLVISHL